MPQNIPKISIVIPVYNTELYLSESIDSILNQTFQDFEIIIVNDCTLDNSQKIIDQYCEQDPRIISIIHETNLGLGGARNTGIKYAKGEYLLFLDSDDWIEGNCIENVLCLMETYHANLGIFSAINFDDSSGKEYSDPYFKPPFRITSPVTVKNLKLISATTWGKIYKTADIVQNSIFFPEHLKHEDEEFWCKYGAKVQPLAVADHHRYYHYRQRHNSIVNFLKGTSHQDMPQIFLNIYDYWNKENLVRIYRPALLWTIANSYNWFSVIVDQKDREEFSKKMRQVLLNFNFSLEELYTMRPEVLFFLIEDPKLQQIFIKMFWFYNDKWYKFGQLSLIKKLRKIICMFPKYIIKKLSLIKK